MTIVVSHSGRASGDRCATTIVTHPRRHVKETYGLMKIKPLTPSTHVEAAAAAVSTNHVLMYSVIPKTSTRAHILESKREVRLLLGVAL